MTPLQTIVPNPATRFRLHQSRPVMLVGSCFTEHIARRLADSGFEVMANPFGILYNPLSIASCLRRCMAEEAKPFTEADLVSHGGLYHSWHHHGSFSAPTADECLSRCNAALSEARDFLKRRPLIIITLGTAYIYRTASGIVAANCHKLPAATFTKSLASVDEVSDAFGFLKGSDVIFTVSPIRHWADGAHGNQLSKSVLHLAVERLLGSGIEYFPAYEIVLDELRDYRFYEADMLHPSSLSVDIIWERFADTYLDPEALQLAKKYQQLHKMEQHRPLFPQSEAYAGHLARTEALRQEIQHIMQQKQ